ncbi:hypothetical protein KCU65_g252, partial [Aureobasidium melanogenum]
MSAGSCVVRPRTRTFASLLRVLRSSFRDSQPRTVDVLSGRDLSPTSHRTIADVSVASAAKIGQDFSRYARPCWIKPVLGRSGSAMSGLASAAAGIYTIKSNLLALLSRTTS